MRSPHLLVDAAAVAAALPADGAPLQSVGDVPVSVTQVLVVASLAIAIAYVWAVDGRGRWRSLAARRLLYGVPWGTAVTVLVVLAFYLFVQGGLWHWSEPLVLPFVSWSYFYGTGTLTAGIAHGSPGHLVSNLTATLALGPIAEYAWGHYADGGSGNHGSDGGAAERAADGGSSDAGSPGGDGADADDALDSEEWSDPPGVGDDGGPNWITNPWLRAVVAFPAALFGVSFLTSALSMVPSLGFSGAVFAIAGFAVVTYPFASIVGILGGSALGTVYRALSEPVVRGTIETGPPQPPVWAGIAVQAHALGFLIGVLLGLALLYVTDRRPVPARIFLATLLFGMVQGLWLVVVPGAEDVFLLYRGVGVVVLLIVTVLVTAAVAGVEDIELASQWRPSGRAVRIGAVVVLVLLTALVALPGPFGSMFVVGADAAPNDDGLTAGDYTVTYAENATSERQFPGNVTDEESLTELERSGVIVVSDDREIWTVGVRDDVLAHDGNATVVVGGVGWRETVEVDRVGWDVAGAETVYAVDLSIGDERTRAFGSEPVAADARIDGHELTVSPGEEAFRVVVERDGTRLGDAAVPEPGESTTVGDLRIGTAERAGTEYVFAETDDARVPIAERETYDGA